jgi:hypothetical protein
MLFKPNAIDEVYVQARYIEYDKKKEQQSGLNHSNSQGDSKKGKKRKEKGKNKNISMIVTTTTLRSH